MTSNKWEGKFQKLQARLHLETLTYILIQMSLIENHEKKKEER